MVFVKVFILNQEVVYSQGEFKYGVSILRAVLIPTQKERGCAANVRDPFHETSASAQSAEIFI